MLTKKLVKRLYEFEENIKGKKFLRDDIKFLRDDIKEAIFIQIHKKCKFESTIGGKISYIITPTGLGEVTIIRCNSCKKKKDITNHYDW